jgi:hypothetical protein
VKQKWVLMTEEILTVAAAETATAVAVVVSEAVQAAPEKWPKLPVLTAVLRLKFRSNQPKDGQFTAEIAFLTTGSSKDNLYWVLIQFGSTLNSFFTIWLLFSLFFAFYLLGVSWSQKHNNLIKTVGGQALYLMSLTKKGKTIQMRLKSITTHSKLISKVTYQYWRN